jgi:acyl carrier protein
VNNVTDLVKLIQEDLGFFVTESDINTHFDLLEGWDSMFTLRLITSIELKTNSKVSVSNLLQASNIQEIYNSLG